MAPTASADCVGTPEAYFCGDDPSCYAGQKCINTDYCAFLLGPKLACVYVPIV